MVRLSMASEFPNKKPRLRFVVRGFLIAKSSGQRQAETGYTSLTGWAHIQQHIHIVIFTITQSVTPFGKRSSAIEAILRLSLDKRPPVD